VKFKLLATAALTALAIVTTTHAHAANVVKLANSGYWEAYYATGDLGSPMCGMKTLGKNSQEFYVKQIAGDGRLLIQLMKAGWNMPAAGVTVPLTLTLDPTHSLQVDANGGLVKPPDGGQFSKVEFYIAADRADDFLNVFAEADNMEIKFEAGNEGYWFASMTGSRSAVKTFRLCTDVMQKRFTQPFATKPPTQPFADKAAPAAKKDDGSL
jgi:hypothetical protein